MLIDKNELAYRVGPLLYMPAYQDNIVDKIRNNSIPYLTSIALCLEDSVDNNYLEIAEKKLVETLKKLKNIEHLPLIFIRVRTPEHLIHIHELAKDFESILTGYILPKFDLGNADEYIDVLSTLPSNIYIMPIIESQSIANPFVMLSNLQKIKAKLDVIKDKVLNVRVGANDLCNVYGLRRNFNSTIYDICLIRDILITILRVFCIDYVVSGPVNEFFDDGSEDWSLPLEKEIKLDILNGFIGKTCIHPSQLPLVYNNLKVDKADYMDAMSMIEASNPKAAVSKSFNGNRMNEKKCGVLWAKKIIKLSSIYGIKEN